MTKWRCVKCGYVWESRAQPKRCARPCGSYWIVKDKKYRQILDNIKTQINESTPLFDRFIIAAEILRSEGITLRPLKTLQMLQRLLEDAQRFEKTPLGEHISVDSSAKEEKTRGLEDLEDE